MTSGTDHNSRSTGRDLGRNFTLSVVNEIEDFSLECQFLMKILENIITIFYIIKLTSLFY